MKKFELGNKLYDYYYNATSEKIPVFINLKNENKEAWNAAANLLINSEIKKVNNYYIDLIGFKTDKDEIIELKKFISFPDYSDYSIKYSIIDNFILVSLENDFNKINKNYQILKLDFSFLLNLTNKFNINNDKELHNQLILFTKHIEKEISE